MNYTKREGAIAVEKRYQRNMNMLSLEENESLKKFKVCVIGCGGLGGYIIEMLSRLGIGYITCVDADVFEETNLNRQILSDTTVLGKSKAMTAKQRVEIVNPLITVNAIEGRFSQENAKEILNGHDAIVDALDNIESRFLLQDIAEELNIPIVHGAIAGWYAQVSTILPGDKTLDRIYNRSSAKGLESFLGNPSFTPALAASVEVSEVLKLLLKRGQLLTNKLAYINLLDNVFNIIDL